MHGASMFVVGGGILLMACGSAPASPTSGRFQGFWEFELSDSAGQRTVTITCLAALELRGTPDRLTGELTLDSCAADSAERRVGSIAPRVSVRGRADWQPAHGVDVAYWRLTLTVRNRTSSIGELLGCTAESPRAEPQFLADVRVDTDPVIVLGGLAATPPVAIRCGGEIMFPTASFALQRTS